MLSQNGRLRDAFAQHTYSSLLLATILAESIDRKLDRKHKTLWRSRLQGAVSILVRLYLRGDAHTRVAGQG